MNVITKRVEGKYNEEILDLDESIDVKSQSFLRAGCLMFVDQILLDIFVKMSEYLHWGQKCF